MIKKILLCTDGSEGALKAARYAAELAHALGAETLVVSIFNPPIGALLWTTAALPMSLDDILDTGETVRAALTRGAETILAAASVSFRVQVETGDPIRRILEIAEQERVDLIVLGSRGLGGFTSLVLGSVCDSILHHAHCPVLVVR